MKTLGFVAGVAGITGYGAVKLATWPLRSLYRSYKRKQDLSRKDIAVFDEATSPKNKSSPNWFLVTMVALAAPAIQDITSYFTKRAFKALNKTAKVAELVLEDVRKEANLNGFQIGAVEVLDNDFEKIELIFGLFDMKNGDIVSSEGRCKIYLSDDQLSATSVHAYYELKNGKIVDILVDEASKNKYRVANSEQKDDEDDEDNNNNQTTSNGKKYIDVDAVDIKRKNEKD